MWTTPEEILDYYARGGEHRRMLDGDGRLEFLRTKDILDRRLPPPPARVLDVGGATGVYADWLVSAGYAVHVVDPVPGHVEAAAEVPGVTAQLGDARALPAGDAAYDVVLLLGPLYHLTERAERVRAFGEAARVVRPGGVVAAAAISRFASTHDWLSKDWLADEEFRAIARADRATGQHRNPNRRPGWFTTAYFHRPEDLATEAADAGLCPEGTLAIEGVGWLLPGLAGHLDDPLRRGRLLELLRELEAEPSLVGTSAHLLTLAKRPAEPPRFS